MRRVSIQKAIKDQVRPSVSFGRVYEGWEDVKPTVGKPYCIFCESWGFFKTSEVVSVSNGFIETLNSFYKLNVLEEEPFDFTEEKDPKNTQRLFFKKGGIQKK